MRNRIELPSTYPAYSPYADKDTLRLVKQGMWELDFIDMLVMESNNTFRRRNIDGRDT